MSNKISENHSCNELKEQIHGFESFEKIYKLAKLFGHKDSKLEETFMEMKELKRNILELAESPDLFNKYFAEKGWIAHENMNSDLMLECIKLASEGKISHAESKLISYFKTEDLTFHIHRLKHMQAFKIRYLLLLKAYEDFKAERYHSCVPLLLMMIDGIVDDVKKENKGFFAENVDLSAWDSIASHETGLKYVSIIFSQSRK